MVEKSRARIEESRRLLAQVEAFTDPDQTPMKPPALTTLSQLQSEIRRAERLVQQGARLLEEQRSRLVRVEGPNSKRLLRTMEETQALHELHLKTLRRELAELSNKE